MSGLDFNAFAENATRLGQRLQESLSEHTRDLPFSRGGAAAYFDTGEDKVKLIRKQLDSSSDRDKLEALKRLLALMSKGRDASEFFAQVVKNVAVPNVEVRKLVYIYILRYADVEPDLALLSINTFQRDLSDSSPLIRAMALRVLAGIPVPSIGSLVVLAIKKSASDPSPYVRKNAALAIPKCYALDDSHLPALLTVLETLLRDRSPLVLGSAAVAFEALVPTRLDLLHPVYRRLCAALLDAEEWGQPVLLDLLVRYARTMLPRPSPGDVDPDLALLLASAEPLFQSCNPAVVVAVARAIYYCALPEEHIRIVSPMLRLLDISPEVERVVLEYILHISHSSPGLFAAHWTRFIVLSSDSEPVKLVKIRLLRSCVSPENHQALLREFIDYASDHSTSFASSAVHGIGHIARVAPESASQCLSALMRLLDASAPAIVSAAVLVLKSLVQTESTVAGGGIVEKLAQRLDDITHPAARACVFWLVGQHAVDASRTGDALAAEGIVEWAPDVLRRGVRVFRTEPPGVKLQILTLASKLLVLSPASHPILALSRYMFKLARYDMDWDVRDRARMLHSLLSGAVPALDQEPASWDEIEERRSRGGVVLRREQVKVVLFDGKAPPAEDDSNKGDEREVLGTASLVLGRDMRGDRIPPDWLEMGIDSLLRTTPEELAAHAQEAVTAIAGPVGGRSGTGKMQGFGNGGVVPGSSRGGGSNSGPVVLTPTGAGTDEPKSNLGKAAYQDLDTFYASESEEEEEEDEEEEEESGEEDEEEDEDGDGTGDEGVEGANGSAEHEVESEESEEDSDDERQPFARRES